MEPITKKKRGIGWSQSDMKNALEEIKNSRMSERAVALKYNIPRRTLKNHMKSGSAVKRMGRKAIFTEAQEKDLAERIKRFSKIGVPLTPKLIRRHAYLFCKKHNIQNCFSDQKSTAGRKWLKNFLARNKDISKRKAQFMNPARAQKLNKAIVEQHFKAIREIYDDLNIDENPERLYNIDEKGCRLTVHRQPQVLAEKGSRRVHLIAQEHAENVTVAICVNAAGMAIPPMILFKGKRMRDEFKENLPPGTLVKMASKGSMTTELFVDFINHLAKYKSPGKCLLVFDGASSHLDYDIVDAAEKQDIVLYCLPSNTTHELQPLDKSINKSFEHFWDEQVLQFNYQNPQKKLTKARFNKILTKVWPKCMTQSNIENGFRATGLYPWDPSAIPEEAFAPSILTHLTIAPSGTGISMTAPSSPECIQVPHDTVDPDATFYDEDNSAQNLTTAKKHVEQANHTLKKIVDYSSSTESAQGEIDSIANNVPTENIRYDSPVPGPSGLHVRYSTPVPGRRPPTLLSSPSEGSDIEHHLPIHLNYPARNIRIYTSSSTASDEERNEIPIQKHVGSKMMVTDSSDDDNTPLSRFSEKQKVSSVQRTPFQQFIPTPNYAQTKAKPRRKAINYIGQRITKDLFKDKEAEKNQKSTKKKKYNEEQTKKGKKGHKNVKANKQKTAEYQQKQNTYKSVTTTSKSKAKQQNESKENSTQKTKIHKSKKLKEDWYCPACKSNNVADMRQCKICVLWYHEECVGLTKEDLDDFKCPDCL